MGGVRHRGRVGRGSGDACVGLRQTVASAEPGAILLLHDGFTPSTADALPCILRRLKAQGYEFGLIYPSSTHKPLNRSDVQIR